MTDDRREAATEYLKKVRDLRSGELLRKQVDLAKIQPYSMSDSDVLRMLQTVADALYEINIAVRTLEEPCE